MEGLSFPFSFFSLKAKSRPPSACLFSFTLASREHFQEAKKQPGTQAEGTGTPEHLASLGLMFLLCRVKGSRPPRCFSAPVSRTLKVF